MVIQLLFLGCCFQDLFNIAGSILVQFPSSFLSIHFAIIHVVHSYNCIDTTTTWKKFHFISLDRSDFHMSDTLSIAVQILDETDYISHSTNTLGKGMNSIILPPAMGKIVGQTRFFSLGEATSLREGKLWIQTCKLHLKIDLVSYPARAEGLVNMINSSPCFC